MAFLLYRIVCIESRKAYIGITTVGEKKRFRKHCESAKRGSMAAIHQAIRKYGKDSFFIEVIDRAGSWEELLEMEIKYIAQFNAFTPNGYNMTLGGEGRCGTQYTYDELRVLSERGKMVWADPELRRKQSERYKGKKWPQEVIDSRKPALKRAARKRWDNPEFRKKHADGVRKNWEKRKANREAHAIFLKKNAEHGKRVMANRKKNDPEFYNKQKQYCMIRHSNNKVIELNGGANV